MRPLNETIERPGSAAAFFHLIWGTSSHSSGSHFSWGNSGNMDNYGYPIAPLKHPWLGAHSALLAWVLRQKRSHVQNLAFDHNLGRSSTRNPWRPWISLETDTMLTFNRLPSSGSSWKKLLAMRHQAMSK